MYQFFVEDEQIGQDVIHIQGADANHISHALRMKPGEIIRISGESGKTYLCHIEEITKDEVVAAIDEVDAQETEFPHKVYLFQGLPKGDKMELVIQKAVELGVYEIIPVEMKNCVVKLDDENERGMAQTRETVRGIPKGADIGVMIGPEGGFAAEEIEEVMKEGLPRISLGKRILRTETAGLVTLSVLIYELDE